MKEHTPGPWINKHWDANNVMAITAIAFRGVNQLALVKPPLTYNMEREEWHCTEANVEECEANARLIAAAPDLLEAAEQLITIWNNLAVAGNSNVGKLKKAIAKARGQ